MKLLAIDLETTGLNPQRDQILQIGAVAFDHEDLETPVEELPYFVTDVRHDRYEGDAYALQMNAWLLRRIDKSTPKLRRAMVGGHSRCGGLLGFVLEHFPRAEYERGPHPVGFNVAAFDVAFIKATGFNIPIHHRPIELGTLLSADGLPVASRTANAAYLGGKEVAHDALEDARDAVRLYRCWKRGLVR